MPGVEQEFVIFCYKTKKAFLYRAKYVACHEAADEDGKWTIHQILVKNKAKDVVAKVISTMATNPVNAVLRRQSLFSFLLFFISVLTVVSFGLHVLHIGNRLRTLCRRRR